MVHPNKRKRQNLDCLPWSKFKLDTRGFNSEALPVFEFRHLLVAKDESEIDKMQNRQLLKI